MKKKIEKVESKIEIKGGPKFWRKYLKKLEKAKKQGCVSCGSCK